ncbi:crotonase/enoyl-CoA hydratase family protein [Pseudoalteromonas phenolica]|uniref:Enoyl-CoA hydratase n=1 Tax=Pseudoalteromonas phenolica TaxID=161398 RepID=A0A0S2K2R6_9GAMM|nr:crotonase/enoyl-CoA hydratase family protein [Pseudoalteromonas phenolica]ALO42561.1 Enoyl-CoA hydratase [Pseudoalteromonas phenolica]MBE0356334.1 hypothetical protein [Pseudoalteromonas phenolica O-BC30]TMO54926.1 enoyl-CoA hydratase [Pseudoalteromonas phenolica]
MVSLEILNDIAYVTLNRPDKQNALSVEMFIQLDQCIKKIKKRREVRAVVIRGDGEHFCSGLDVKSVMAKPLNIIKLLFKWLPGNANLVQRVVLGWHTIPVPVISLMQGNSFGGGLHIALGADIRIAKDNTKLAIMESRWGLCPDMGSAPLLLGLTQYDKALLLSSQGDPINAEQACELGLITEVSENPEKRCNEIIKQLKTRSPDALAAIKRLNQASFHFNRRSILAKETWSQIKLLLSKNTRISMHNATKEVPKPFKIRRKW